MLLASFVNEHQVKKVPTHNALVLQEETGAEVGAISQEDDMLWVVRGQDKRNIEDGLELAIANQ